MSIQRPASGDVWMYNLATPNERGLPHAEAQAQVGGEIRRILNEKPILLGGVEAISYSHLPDDPDYIQTRDFSTDSRKNIVSYVRRDVGVVVSHWLDQHTTWPQTNPGAHGTHPARSFLVQRLGNGWQFIVAHQAPKNAATVEAAQREGFDRLMGAMGRWAKRPMLHPFAKQRPRIVVGDFNSTGGPSSPEALAAALHCLCVDTNRIDTAVVRNLAVSHVAYPVAVGGVLLKSDHKSALRFTVGPQGA